MERFVNAMEENPEGKNIMKVCKDYTTEDAILVIEKAVTAWNSKYLLEKTLSRGYA